MPAPPGPACRLNTTSVVLRASSSRFATQPRGTESIWAPNLVRSPSSSSPSFASCGAGDRRPPPRSRRRSAGSGGSPSKRSPRCFPASSGAGSFATRRGSASTSTARWSPSPRSGARCSRSSPRSSSRATWRRSSPTCSPPGRSAAATWPGSRSSLRPTNRSEVIDMLDWLLTYAAHSTLLLAGAWLLSIRLRSHAVPEPLWKTALFGAFLPATAQVVLGVTPLPGRVVLAAPAGGRDGVAPIRGVSAPATGAAALEQASTPDRVAGPAGLTSAGLSARIPPARDLVVPAWLVVAGALLAVFLLRRARLARRLASRRPVMTHPLAELLRTLSLEAGITRPIRLTASPRLASPVALGSSEIAVPEAALSELDAGQQRGMLAHELAHLERRDPGWLVLAGLVERIGFFQPLNRLARRRIQESAEYLADEWAVRRTGSGVSLATCLAKVAEWIDAAPSAVPVAGMAEERSHLVARVRRLLEGGPFPANPRRRTIAAVAALGVVGVTLGLPGI